ncbi:MAG: hypothetical protein WAL88_06310 [Nitrosotalea sp.]
MEDMIDFSDSLVILSVVVLMISVSIGGMYYLDKTRLDKKQRTPTFSKLQRTRYKDGSWSILLYSPSRSIAKCNATFRDVPLFEIGSNYYEKSLALEEGMAFLVPYASEDDDDGLIKIRDGKIVIIKEKFNKIPIRKWS